MEIGTTRTTARARRRGPRRENRRRGRRSFYSAFLHFSAFGNFLANARTRGPRMKRWTRRKKKKPGEQQMTLGHCPRTAAENFGKKTLWRKAEWKSFLSLSLSLSSAPDGQPNVSMRAFLRRRL